MTKHISRPPGRRHTVDVDAAVAAHDGGQRRGRTAVAHVPLQDNADRMCSLNIYMGDENKFSLGACDPRLSRT
jgi:hypothetical protein